GPSRRKPLKRPGRPWKNLEASCRYAADFPYRRQAAGAAAPERRAAGGRPTDIQGMQTVVIIFHLMVVLAMTGLVLLQRSEGGGLGIGGGGGGGGGGSFLSGRGTSNMLT